MFSHVLTRPLLLIPQQVLTMLLFAVVVIINYFDLPLCSEKNKPTCSRKIALVEYTILLVPNKTTVPSPV